MKPTLHILHLEDEPNDAELVQATLENGGLSCALNRVETRADFLAALEAGGVDLVISDYSLPHFDGLAALKLLRSRWPVLPFILVSGTLGEEVAVESLKCGATDYVLKDRLSRLVPAVIRALDDLELQHIRSQAEEELRWKTALLEAQLNASIDGILVVDNHARKLLQNERMLELWKIPPEIAEDPNDEAELRLVVAQVSQPEHFLEKVKHLYSRPQEISRDEIELKDGRVLDRYSSPVLDKQGRYYGRIWTFRDITERKVAEAQLRQAQKMEAVGRLAAGVAHDFNNLLTVILGYSGLLLADEGQCPAARDSLNEIKKAGERAARLTRQLLAFSRQQVLQPTELNLNAAVADCAKMLQRLVGEDIRMEVVLDPGVKQVRVDPGQLEQALMNLVVNARDAIPQFGNITIATAAATLDETYCRHHPDVRPGQYVSLAVTDSGGGMDEATQAQIFEPFFTTKGPGKGTGLGLSMVFGFIRQSGGHVTVASRVGSGSTFTIYLPALEGEEGSLTDWEPAEPLPAGAETVLLVEDETGVRMLSRQILLALGYTVLEATQGEEALKLAETHGHAIHLLITDMVMPGMGGSQLAAQMRILKPAIKILLVSGYSGDALLRHGGLIPGTFFLQKPFSMSTLAVKVREILDQPGAGIA